MVDLHLSIALLTNACNLIDRCLAQRIIKALAKRKAG